MSVASPPSPTLAVATASWSRRLGEFLLVAAHVPLVVAYFVRLWTLPHYQFFPLAIVGAYLLIRRSEREPKGAASASGVVAALICGLSLLAGAVVFDSPWLGAVAATINFTAWQAARCGSWRPVMPAAAMLVVILRPPLGIDTWLIRSLQHVTAAGADMALDVLGVLHSTAGNVIELPGRRLLVEEACSGVNSLFSATAATLFYLLWNRRGWISSVLLFISIPGWVVFANIVRVVVVAVLCDRWDVDADTGVLHDILGLATFALAVILIVSTERFLQFYACVVERPPTTNPATSTGPASCVASASDRGWVIGGVVATVIGLAQLPALAARVERYAVDWRIDAVPSLAETWAHDEEENWHRADYQRIERDRNSPFGRFSQSWTVADGARQTTLSLDYPFIGWHELTECYEAQGWRVETRRVIDAAGDQVPTIKVVMRHESTNRYGRLYFSLLTRDGRAFPVRRLGEIDEWLDRAAARWRALVSARSAKEMPDVDELTYQIQLFVSDLSPLFDEDRNELLGRFHNFRTKLSRRLADDLVTKSHDGGASP